jgi:hypothetical protein
MLVHIKTALSDLKATAFYAGAVLARKADAKAAEASAAVLFPLTPEDRQRTKRIRELYRSIARATAAAVPPAFRQAQYYAAGDEGAPIMTEAFLYSAIGKEDARTVLSFFGRLGESLGFDRYSDLDDVAPAPPESLLAELRASFLAGGRTGAAAPEGVGEDMALVKSAQDETGGRVDFAGAISPGEALLGLCLFRLPEEGRFMTPAVLAPMVSAGTAQSIIAAFGEMVLLVGMDAASIGSEADETAEREALVHRERQERVKAGRAFLAGGSYELDSAPAEIRALMQERFGGPARVTLEDGSERRVHHCRLDGEVATIPYRWDPTSVGSPTWLVRVRASRVRML